MRTRLVLLAMTLTTAALVLPGAPAQARAMGHVTGSVTGPDGPLEGITASAYDSNLDVAGSATTDAAGHYDLTAPPGSYRVEFEQAFFSIATLQPEWWKDETNSSQATEITVGSGATVSGIDAELAPFAGVRGRVTGTDGAGVRSKVEVWAFDPGCCWYGPVVSAESDAQGRYEIDHLVRGQIRLEVTPLVDGYRAEFYDDARVLEDATDIDLDHEVVTVGDVRLDRGLAVVRKPRIVGRPVVGRRLDLRIGRYSPRPDVVRVRWFADGKRIPRQHEVGLDVTATLLGKRLRAEVTASKAGYGKLKATSKRTGRVTRPGAGRHVAG